jgi:hypothetical protein
MSRRQGFCPRPYLGLFARDKLGHLDRPPTSWGGRDMDQL